MTRDSAMDQVTLNPFKKRASAGLEWFDLWGFTALHLSPQVGGRRGANAGCREASAVVSTDTFQLLGGQEVIPLRKKNHLHLDLILLWPSLNMNVLTLSNPIKHPHTCSFAISAAISSWLPWDFQWNSSLKKWHKWGSSKIFYSFRKHETIPCQIHLKIPLFLKVYFAL